jgi:hypothetical protein
LFTGVFQAADFLQFGNPFLELAVRNVYGDTPRIGKTKFELRPATRFTQPNFTVRIQNVNQFTMSYQGGITPHTAFDWLFTKGHNICYSDIQ